MTHHTRSRNHCRRIECVRYQRLLCMIRYPFERLIAMNLAFSCGPAHTPPCVHDCATGQPQRSDSIFDALLHQPRRYSVTVHFPSRWPTPSARPEPQTLTPSSASWQPRSGTSLMLIFCIHTHPTMKRASVAIWSVIGGSRSG